MATLIILFWLWCGFLFWFVSYITRSSSIMEHSAADFLTVYKTVIELETRLETLIEKNRDNMRAENDAFRKLEDGLILLRKELKDAIDGETADRRNHVKERVEYILVEIEKVIDEKLLDYDSGIKTRLAFSHWISAGVQKSIDSLGSKMGAILLILIAVVILQSAGFNISEILRKIVGGN